MLLVAAPAQAAIIMYTDRASFDAATGGGLGFESFESPFVAGPSVSFTGFTLTESGDGIIDQVLQSSVFGATNGSYSAQFQTSTSTLTLQFNSPIGALGFDLTTLKPSTVTIGGDIIDSVTTTPLVPKFVGYVDNSGGTFQTVTINYSGRDTVAIDSVSFGTVPPPSNPVPEPASVAVWSLFTITGLGFVFWSRRRPQPGFA